MSSAYVRRPPTAYIISGVDDIFKCQHKHRNLTEIQNYALFGPETFRPYNLRKFSFAPRIVNIMEQLARNSNQRIQP